MKFSDQPIASTLAPDSIVAIDRGYNDYKLFAYWTEHDIYFVTRLKANADYITLEKQEIPKDRNILSDDLIEFAAYSAQGRGLEQK